ncbi:hypothetical protein OV079_19660 [Nannocystis pusilla]|uniref:GH26 domain-containing protein n=1 Tax=Nannocystis pusilla TaxID=889268 RepID=A0A9X3EY18_9BACT|nr:hypothetical protein [Nannocystis pusilla]MCY1007728.1 hypothetical protein [Nannocystis pusilla]
MKIGATIVKDEIGYWKPKLAKNEWMRIFPNSDGMLPAWDDPRFKYMQDVGGQPFASTKLDGDTNKIKALRTRLLDLPGWISTLWLTDRHEPEGDFTASQYKAHFKLYFDMIKGLPADIRARIKCGPVLTRQATENSGGLGTYATYDPGVGDFFGVDMYGNSWGSGGKAATSYVDPKTFLAKVKTYDSKGRQKLFPEIGYVGLPFDSDGSKRAQWIEGITQELKTWSNFVGYIWWNANGKEGSSISGLGTKRYFQLDRRHTGTDGSYKTLNPALPLNKFNSFKGI